MYVPTPGSMDSLSIAIISGFLLAFVSSYRRAWKYPHRICFSPTRNIKDELLALQDRIELLGLIIFPDGAVKQLSFAPAKAKVEELCNEMCQLIGMIETKKEEARQKRLWRRILGWVGVSSTASTHSMEDEMEESDHGREVSLSKEHMDMEESKSLLDTKILHTIDKTMALLRQLGEHSPITLPSTHQSRNKGPRSEIQTPESIAKQAFSLVFPLSPHTPMLHPEKALHNDHDDQDCTTRMGQLETTDTTHTHLTTLQTLLLHILQNNNLPPFNIQPNTSIPLLLTTLLAQISAWIARNYVLLAISSSHSHQYPLPSAWDTVRTFLFSYSATAAEFCPSSGGGGGGFTHHHYRKHHTRGGQQEGSILDVTRRWMETIGIWATFITQPSHPMFFLCVLVFTVSVGVNYQVLLRRCKGAGRMAVLMGPIMVVAVCVEVMPVLFGDSGSTSASAGGRGGAMEEAVVTRMEMVLLLRVPWFVVLGLVVGDGVCCLGLW